MNIPRPVAYALIGVLALVIVVVVVLNLRSGQDEPSETTPPTSVSTTEAPAPSDGGGASDNGGDEGDEGDDLLYDGQKHAGPDVGLKDGSESDRAASSEVAKEAVAVWVNHDLSTEEWSKALRPYVTDEAWDAPNLPAPQRVSATEITGEIKDGPDGVSSGTAEYLVPTDAGELLVALVLQGEDWKISYIDKEL